MHKILIAFLKVILFLLPFTNEMANVLTLSKIKINNNYIFKSLYRDCLKYQTVSCNDDGILMCSNSDNNIISLINFIALTGIILNICFFYKQKGFKMAILFGMILIILSFVIPNTYMEKMINIINNLFFPKKNRNVRYKKKESLYIFISGFIVIFVLTLITILIHHLLIRI